MKGFGDMMKKAQNIQADMQRIQEKLTNQEVFGESGTGLVKVIMNGRRDVKKVNISDELLTENKTVLEDLIAAAMNDAVHKVEKINKSMMSDLTSGLQLPPGFKMPF